MRSSKGGIIRHRGHKKAIVAVAHAILEIAYHFLAKETRYAELGADSFERRDKERASRRYARLLEQLGHRVTLAPMATPA